VSGTVKAGAITHRSKERIMLVGYSFGERSSALIALLVILPTFAMLTCDLVSAQQGRTGGPTPSPEGAAVYFVGLNDGDTVQDDHPLRST
jgi:hypothetical protein